MGASGLEELAGAIVSVSSAPGGWAALPGGFGFLQDPRSSLLAPLSTASASERREEAGTGVSRWEESPAQQTSTHSRPTQYLPGSNQLPRLPGTWSLHSAHFFTRPLSVQQATEGV